MTPEQITKWAVEVGMSTVMEFGYTRFASPKQLQEFANLVRQHTMEEAAKAVEYHSVDWAICPQIARQIRSLK
jgi:uncharacterized protein YecA (UPF0149 family)